MLLQSGWLNQPLVLAQLLSLPYEESELYLIHIYKYMILGNSLSVGRCLSSVDAARPKQGRSTCQSQSMVLWVFSDLEFRTLGAPAGVRTKVSHLIPF